LDTVAEALRGFAPITARAREATLLAQGDDGRWRTLDRYALREGAAYADGAAAH
jgi:hypothetical protein